MIPESHFTSLLHTNYVPSAKELNELQNLILEPKQRIERFNDEIHRLQAERDELQQFVDNHSALTSPFRRFPADIWSEIFAQCLPTNKLNVALCTSKEPPLLLTAVCRAWREIALNTPRLWSALHVCVACTDTNLAFPAFLEGIKLWLDRSGSRPLTLSVSMSDCTPLNSPAAIDLNSTPYTALMDLLACYSHRWKTISLHFSVDSSHLRSLERLTRADLPLLETLYIAKCGLFVEVGMISGSPIPPRVDPTPFANLLPQLPSFRSLHSQPASPAVLNLASTCRGLTQLTLGLSMPPTVVLRQIASSCRDLHILTIHSDLWASPEDDAAAMLFANGPPIEWPSLQELNLLLEGSGYYVNTGGTASNTPHPFLQRTFESILTPQLRRLFIQFPRVRPKKPLVENTVPFQSLIASSPHLMHLQLSGYAILNAEALSQCLQLAPSLATLALRARAPLRTGRRGFRQGSVVLPLSGWLQRLLSSLNDLCACPEMEMLDCGRCRHTEINSILEFAQSWDRRMSRLKCLRADLGHLDEEEIYTVNSDAVVQALRALRGTNDISMDLEWERVAKPEPTKSHFDPSQGMPTGTSPWADDIFLSAM
ncbi:hypothetical protein PQX77_015928 [Marasmius sp. AFHP31]|nr:hypothetical protein PQX77_015928 [Marasmius sp. AFHP31]